MRPRLLLVILIGLAFGGLAAWLASMATGPGVPSSGKAAIGGPFTLTDHTGRRVTEQDFRGRKTLVYFGFTSCPDICPSGLQVISAALEALGPKGESVTPLFITVDPERDTEAKMAAYVKSFHPRLVGLTGNAEEIAAAAKAYRVYFRKAQDAKSGDYSVDHSSIAYLMDENGLFLSHFPHPSDAAKLAAALAKFL